MKITAISRALLLLLSVASCVDIQGPEMEALRPDDTFDEIRIRSRAIMIAKGDSHTIGFDLVAMDESLIPFNPKAIKWTSSEARVVSVSATGTIRANEISNGPIPIAVQYVHKYVTRVDTVKVYVTEDRIDANGVKLISLDSNRIGGSGLQGVPRVRVDLYKDGQEKEKGVLIPIDVDPPIEVKTNLVGGPDSKPVYEIYNPKFLVGKFWIRASLNLYGNEVTDSISFTGLYNDFLSVSAGDLPANYPVPIPILDTIPIRFSQLCSAHVIVNLSSSPIDVAFSDSTAGSTGCEPGSDAFIRRLGLPVHGIFIGGNVLSMPPRSTAIRKSNTAGVVSYRIRNSNTKEYIPWFTNHIRQIDIED